MGEQPGRTLIARRAMVVVGYWLLWFVAWRLAIPFEVAPRISIWWSPSSVSLAFLILFGLRYLPAVAVPQLSIMALIVPSHPLLWLAVTAALCASYGGAAGAVRRYARPGPFTSVRNACVFLLAACCGAAVVATAGSLLFGLVAGGPWGNIERSILSWWIGDLAAMTAVTPFLILVIEPLTHWVDGRAPPQTLTRALSNNLALISAVAAIVIALAIVVIGARTTGYTWFFVLLLPALYAGYALGPRGGMAVTLIVALCSLGLLHADVVQTRPLDLQFFMIGTAVTSLLFSIVVDDWRRVRESLLEEQAQLERRVEARTAELAETNALLEGEVRVRRDAEKALLEAKEAAEASYRELETIYSSAPIGLALIDSDLRYLRVNDTLAEYNGVAIRDHLGRTVGDVVPEIAPILVPQMRRVLDHGEAVSFEVRGETTRFPGAEMIWLCDFYPLERPEGTVEAVCAIVQEVTEQRRAEEALRRSKEIAEQASALKSRFLAATSHDLRQPLQTLALLQGILAERTKDEDAGRVIGQMGVAIDVMTDTLNALLDLDGLEKGRLEPRPADFPVQVLLDRIVSEFSSRASAKGLELRRIDCKAVIRSDQRLLERLVENLVANAVKYTIRGKILVGCRRRGRALRIDVWDTGPGVPAGEREMIFEQFYRGRTAGGGRERGLGLGLALVRSLADILGHPVGIQSVEGKGSVFFVEVPLGEAKPIAPPLPLPAPALPDERQTVIVIEDNAAVRESLHMLLSGSGYEVISVAGGEEAVELVEEKGISPALVIADHNLPGVLSGVEAAERIRGRRGKVPGLILTGEASREKLDRYTALGLSWVQKPVKAEDLLARVRELLPTRAEPEAPAAALPADGGEDEEADADAGTPTVFIVEDDEGLRSALAMVLEHEGLRAKAFATAQEFLAKFRRDRNGCILIDIGLPGMNGLQLQQRLTAEGIELPVVIVSGRSEVALAVQAMRDGAVDFLQKPVNDRMLVETVHRALRRSEAHFEIETEREQVKEHVARLTPREREILAMVASGLANKEIAARLKISQRTVENHRARVMHKMEARSLADLVRATSMAGIALPPAELPPRGISPAPR